MYQKSLALLATIASALAVAGCNEVNSTNVPAQVPSASAIDQKNICQVDNWERESVAQSCSPGQKVIYLPTRWGNEQLPILFAAVNCDLQYAVVQSPGAVTCIYNPIKLDTEQQPKSDAPNQPTPPQKN